MMSYEFSKLTAANPRKLAETLQDLPEGAVIFAWEPTGPRYAMPTNGKPVIGGYYYRGDRIGVWNGANYFTIAILTEWDGKPTLQSKIGDVEELWN